MTMLHAVIHKDHIRVCVLMVILAMDCFVLVSILGWGHTNDNMLLIVVNFHLLLIIFWCVAANFWKFIKVAD